MEELRAEWMRVEFVGAKRLFEWLMNVPGSGWDRARTERVLREAEEMRLGAESIGVRISMW